MRALDKKLLRDLSGLRGQAIAIALVVAAGVAAYVAMTSVVDTLDRTLDTYYREQRFADGFASVERAPEPVAPRLANIAGIGRVETRVTAMANLEIRGFDEPVQGHLVSLPKEGPRLNRVVLREGRFPRPGRDEVVVNEVFAEAHALQPGDRITATVAGRERTLRVAGIGLSPEFLMQLQPGALFPDAERYGVMWIGRARLAALADMEGAFNDVAFTFAPDANETDVLAAVDRVLDPYGGRGAYGREDQRSHFLITEELAQLRRTAAVLPTIFLLVAAFLLHIVVTRVVSLERDVIALLKAFGYRNAEVGAHYLALVLLIALPGAAAGTGLGMWLGRNLSDLYLEFYRFPYLDHELRVGVIAAAVGMTAGASVLGALQAVRRAVKLAPAEAMRPPAPARYRRALVERLGIARRLDQPTRMLVRHIERQPLRSSLAILGIASACAILVMGLFFRDSIDRVVDVEYRIARRDDLTVTFFEPQSSTAVREIESLPGVRYAEPVRRVPVRLRHGHRRHDTAIEGVSDDPVLRRVVGDDLEPIRIPERGAVLSERLAELLDADPGDEITAEVQEGARHTRRIRVVGVARQFLGLGAYMDFGAANRLAGGGRAVTGTLVAIDAADEDRVVSALSDRPDIASIASKRRAIESYLESAGETMLTFTFVLSVFAGVIAFGVVYSGARISLGERARELATLRVLGFTRAEIGYILLGELALLTLVAIPIGLALGLVASRGIAASVETEMYQFPAVVSRQTFATAASIVLVSALASALVVARRLSRLDLVGVLKSRE